MANKLVDFLQKPDECSGSGKKLYRRGTIKSHFRVRSARHASLRSKPLTRYALHWSCEWMSKGGASIPQARRWHLCGKLDSDKNLHHSALKSRTPIRTKTGICLLRGIWRFCVKMQREMQDADRGTRIRLDTLIYLSLRVHIAQRQSPLWAGLSMAYDKWVWLPASIAQPLTILRK